ncbi:MAG: AAA family ATPase [Rhodobacteraceae bacterium]|nr:AAA family ATPase [Paracoccaceae bacterium]
MGVAQSDCISVENYGVVSLKVVVSANFGGLWPEGVEEEYPLVFLTKDTWDDYGFQTKFFAEIRLSADEIITVGSVKLAYWGHEAKEGSIRALLPASSPGLPENYYSLGQKLEFYQTLSALPRELQNQYAHAMRDITMLRIPEEQLSEEDAFDVSLTRSSGAREAFDKAPELFGDDNRRVDAFQFTTQIEGAESAHIIDFDFTPNSGLPSRINALVGVNGVGKTQLMARLAILLSQFEKQEEQDLRKQENGNLRELGLLKPVPSFYSIIAVSFSAFDDFELPSAEETENFRYVYCGLRGENGIIQDDSALAERMPTLFEQMPEARQSLARDLIGDAIGREVTAQQIGEAEWYRSLSAGQRIVANIICELILHLRSQSLVLLDEPETHLHPQLMSRLLSILNSLLEGFDSSAVIATHSPIVVQQVMARRVHIVRRIEDTPVVSNPLIETFGENLTDIVRKVFSAIEGDRGYQEVLDNLYRENGESVEAVEALFDGRLGFNAQMYLRSKEA